jgi:hypothetical protein
VSLLKGDRHAIKTLDSYKADIENLVFENQTLRKDLSESARLLQEYQLKELDVRQKDSDLATQEKSLTAKLEERVLQLSAEQDKLRGEQDRMSQVRAAYNADKHALVERIEELESALRQRDLDR